MNMIMASFVATLLHITQPYAASHGRVLTQSDTLCLAEAIYHEARGEHDGGAAIAFVALNRAALYNQTLCQVIHAKHQFSYYNPAHPKPIHEPDTWKFSAYLAVYTQLGLIHNPIGNATSYNQAPVRSWLRELDYTKKIDHMYFYEIKQYKGLPPLIQTHFETTPMLPRQIVCDTADYRSDIHHIRPPLRVSERPKDVSPYKSTVHEDHETKTGDHANLVTVALPDTIPFPEQPSLSQGQVFALVSAFAPPAASIPRQKVKQMGYIPYGVTHHATHNKHHHRA